MQYNVECSRCLGSGRYDRGACFRCKGRRYTKTSRKPSGTPISLVVIYENGSQNHIKMYFNRSDYAIRAVEEEMYVRGWKGRVEKE